MLIAEQDAAGAVYQMLETVRQYGLDRLDGRQPTAVATPAADLGARCCGPGIRDF